MKLIKDQTMDQERALYNLKNSEVRNCIFAGESDGESVLKESRNILVNHSVFALRYPLWHAHKYEIKDSEFAEQTRAAIWYAKNGKISSTKFNGVKLLRECRTVGIDDCTIVSAEFGWKCQDVTIFDSNLVAEYCLFESKNIEIHNLHFSGKYSFQYTKNVIITNSELDTKDAFWHSKNVTVKDSIVKGEYLGWFSDGLTLINCTISGTQPLCYCKNLKLVNCTMEDCDLAFEYSDVEAELKGSIVSIKNPKSGLIVVDKVGQIIHDDPVMPCKGKVKIRK